MIALGWHGQTHSNAQLPSLSQWAALTLTRYCSNVMGGRDLDLPCIWSCRRGRRK